MPSVFRCCSSFCFPHEKLSVQVHPDDEQARARRPALGQNRVLVCGARQAGSAGRVGTETRRHRAQVRGAIHAEPRRRSC